MPNPQGHGLRYTSGPNKGRFMKRGTSKEFKEDKCAKCELLKQNQENGKIFTPPNFEWNGHRIIDMQKLADGLWCQICDIALSLKHCIEEKRDGVTSSFRVKCPKCGKVKIIQNVDKKHKKPIPISERFEKIVTRKSTAKSKINLDCEQCGCSKNAFPKTQNDSQGNCSLWSVGASCTDWPGLVLVPPVKEKIPEVLEVVALEENGDIGDIGDEEDFEFVIEEDKADSDWEERNLKPVKPAKPEELEPKIEIFYCEYCSAQFNSLFANRLHMKEKHEDFNNRICGWCKKQCCSDSAFRNHRRSHRSVACVCEVCGKECRDEKHLEFHKLDHLPDHLAKKFSCTFCGKRYKTEQYVNKHEQTHTTHRPYICNECPKKFKLKIRLEEHMQLHTGEFKFNCEICNARFTRKDNMTQHLKHNHRFVCPICNYTFTTAEDVKLHRNETHSKEEIDESEAAGHAAYYKYTDFQCDVCHKFLASKQSLNFHIATHTGEGKKRPASSKTKQSGSSKILKIDECNSDFIDVLIEMEEENEAAIQDFATC